MNTGYVISNGNTIRKDVSDNFVLACKEIATSFEDVRTVFRDEWIGYDEIDFENKLIDKLDALALESQKFAQAAVDTVGGMIEAWINFQDLNTLSGGSSGAKAAYAGVIKEVIVPTPPNIPKLAKAFSLDANTGLQSSNSSEKLTSSLGKFVTNVKNSINSIFEVVTSNKAFYGEQQETAFANFIKSVNEKMQDVQTSIKDLNDAMVSLTAEYKAMDTNVNTQLGEAKTNVDAIDLGTTRWVDTEK